jgi:hypothetical protein
MAMKPDQPFYSHVARELVQGSLTPFLGAGANTPGLLPQDPFVPGQRLPTGSELAEDLAQEFMYPGEDRDLVRVSQWVAIRLGPLTLYRYLHNVFDHDYTPTALHRLMARMPQYVREQQGLEYPLFITTNYDYALERAFEEAGEEYDLLTYLAAGPDLGKFRHTTPDGESKVIDRPNRYKGVTLLERPAIAKIHGAVARGVKLPDDDSYVVTEDDYIDCLTRTDIVTLLPPSVVQRMQRCHYLFLGYSLRDWNLRAILHRIRRDRALANESWVVSSRPDPLEEKAWNNRNVEMFEADLDDFAEELDARMTPLASATDG